MENSKYWYEHCPGMIILRPCKKGKTFYIDIDKFLLFLIKEKEIEYKDVWPNWSKKVKLILKDKKIKKGNEWFAGNTNTNKMLIYLFKYCNILAN